MKQDYGVGSVVVVNFEGNQKYFYNSQNWSVEEAYRAFEPNYETVITDDFIEECSNKIWIIDWAYGSLADNIDNDTEYNKISEKQFFTKYHNYEWKITLLEK